MNEILGGIRMIKFMAWERNFESRVHKVRRKELKYQRRNYLIEVIYLPGEYRFSLLIFASRSFSTLSGIALPSS